MNSIKLNGKQVLEKTKSELKECLEQIRKNRDNNAKNPKLVIFLVGKDPASILYTNLKKKDCEEIGIDCEIKKLDTSISEEDLIYEIKKCNESSDVTGFIIQIPLPRRMNLNNVLMFIDPKKDVDGLHPLNMGYLASDFDANTFPIPCTALAIARLAESYAISFENKNVAILGRGKTVGRPIQLLLSNKKYNATTTLLHSKSKDMKKYLFDADVIISATGNPNMIQESDIRDGCVLFDLGISKVDGKVIGDIDKKCYEKAKYYAPVVGGVGPVTRAMLLNNLVNIYKNNDS